MKTRTIAVITLALFLCSCSVLLSQGDAYRRLIKKVSPALVQVMSIRLGPGGAPGATAMGSGFLVEGGYVVTNEHVIEGGHVVGVKLGEDEYYVGDMVSAHMTHDIAVIRLVDVPDDMPYVEFARRPAERGDTIWMIGRNRHFDMSFKTGVVSYGQRQWAGTGSLQTTMPVIPGESGSAVFNARGKVIGVARGYYPNAPGVAVCVSLEVAREVVKELIADIEARDEK